jgi:hypothetical protein
MMSLSFYNYPISTAATAKSFTYLLALCTHELVNARWELATKVFQVVVLNNSKSEVPIGTRSTLRDQKHLLCQFLTEQQKPMSYLHCSRSSLLNLWNDLLGGRRHR